MKTPARAIVGDKKQIEQHMALLESRIHRSIVVGSQTRGEDNAVCYYDRQDDAFAIVIKNAHEEHPTVYEAVVRTQWERKVLVLGNLTPNKSFVACGHVLVNGNRMLVRLAGGKQWSMPVDAAAPYLAQLKSEPQTIQIERPRRAFRQPAGPIHQSVSPYMHAAPTRRPYPPRVRSVEMQYPHSPVLHSSNDAFADEDDFSAEDMARLRGDLPISQPHNRFV